MIAPSNSQLCRILPAQWRCLDLEAVPRKNRVEQLANRSKRSGQIVVALLTRKYPVEAFPKWVRLLEQSPNPETGRQFEQEGYSGTK